MRAFAVVAVVGCLLAGCGAADGSGDSAAGGTSAGAGGGPGGGQGAGGGAGQGTGGGGGAPTIPELPRAAGIAIGQVAVYQGVKVTLYDQGVEVARNAPVVAGRPALLRVFVEPLDEWQPREITVRVRLGTPTGEYEPLVASFTPTAKSSDEDLESTINFELPPELLDGQLSYIVELLEVANDVQAPGSTLGAAMPADGSSAFGEEATGGPLKLVVLPIRYKADGSGRVPDVSDERIAQFRDGMLKMYPASEVEIEVAEPLDWTQKVQSNGAGWDTLLEGVLQARQKAKTPKNVYYYGLINPAGNMFSFCSFGCVAGLTFLTSNSFDASVRGSVGLGFMGKDAISTMAHEIGHAHGRLHAPCSIPDPSSIDKKFPDKQGKLQVWGYDLIDKSLIPPQKTADFMGYCTPVWVSDYTFSALFSRIKSVNAGNLELPGERRAFEVATLGVSGGLRWAGVDERTDVPGGDAREVELLDEQGHEVGRVTGYFYPSSHVAGGRLLLPPGTPHAARVRVRGEGEFGR